MIGKLFPWLCDHPSTYLERRPIYDLWVPHYVCESCGHAEPVLRRSSADYERGQSLQVPPPKAKKHEPPTASDRARVLESVTPFRKVAK